MTAAIYKHKRGKDKNGMDKILFQVRYQLYFPDGSTKDKYKYCGSQRDANTLCRRAEFLENSTRSHSAKPKELIMAQHEGLMTEEEALKFAGNDAVVAYDLKRVFENYKTTNKVSNTAYGHTINLRRADFILGWLEDYPIPTLTENDVRVFILGRLEGTLVHVNTKNGRAVEGVAPKTVRNDLEVLRAIIDEAVTLGMVANNVARKVDCPDKRKKLRRALSKTEITNFLDAAKANAHLAHGYAYYLAMIALYTGMRRAELKWMTWDDVDLDESVIKIEAKEIDGEEFTTKSGEADVVVIPDRLRALLKEMPREGRFVLGGHRMLNLENITNSISLIIKRARLPPELSLHNLRHTYGSWLLKKSGGDLKYVQGALRHLDINTTKQYAHVIIGEEDPAKGFDYD
ncbi:tyrosine-type recombinase/integrase [Oryzomonas rubra]|uniref:Site-specific integrase n=1 Tax=Oryzomonas rubra TaxID=2509454 RepID=A0A5A9X6P8_9BACT|nr:site-specific integrase [Oryzomonas rubra]KAA0888696.1 site-specific integrase [Oryzomonas rubra]